MLKAKKDLLEADGEEIDKVFKRWCDNLRHLNDMQGLLNESVSKMNLLHFRDKATSIILNHVPNPGCHNHASVGTPFDGNEALRWSWENQEDDRASVDHYTVNNANNGDNPWHPQSMPNPGQRDRTSFWPLVGSWHWATDCVWHLLPTWVWHPPVDNGLHCEPPRVTQEWWWHPVCTWVQTWFPWNAAPTIPFPWS